MHQAQVSYQMGQLTVLTENSSLNQILREVARQTGMKITGSIADQQVYGTYGPAAPAKVLGQLLEGSGVNMILRETTAKDPLELVLMPMQGMPAAAPSYSPNYSPNYAPAFNSQPNPSQPAYQPPQNFSPPQPRSQYTPPPQPVYGGTTGISQPPAPVSQSSDTSAPDQQSQPASDMPQSPTGVRTPQQIFEQLQRLQQQKAQQPAPAQ